MIRAVLLVALLMPACKANTQVLRTKLANHVVSLGMAFFEAQRAGVIPEDSAELFPNIWEWKQPGYTNMCSDAIAALPPTDAQWVDLQNYGGYFEAGNAVTATGPLAFTAVQQSIGALAFMPALAANTPQAAIPDSAGCLKGDFTTMTMKELYLRQMRFVAKSLSVSIIKSRPDGSDFAILIGVADSSTYDGELPSWNAPPSDQNKCYIGDMQNPAADIAAQTAAGLAMSALVASTHGTPADATAGNVWLAKARRAYAYAKLMVQQYGPKASCSMSSATENCVGKDCVPADQVQSTCELYINNKPSELHLFVAAAALWYATGEAGYRSDADLYWDPIHGTYLYNWNNVVAQGVVLLAMAPDLPGAKNSQEYYRSQLRTAAGYWSQCSNDGSSGRQGPNSFWTFCKKTPGGSAYPVDFPWGNIGTIINGMCLSSIYQHLAFDPPQNPMRVANRCFLHRQMGYAFNHKCTEETGGSCATAGPEGFSYMVGFGSHYPTKIHSRDAAYPNFRVPGSPDGSTLCGAVVSGPGGSASPVEQGTDVYQNNRDLWEESEPAIDYAGSLICAMYGYAAQPDGAFAGCDVRTVFDGRTAAP